MGFVAKYISCPVFFMVIKINEKLRKKSSHMDPEDLKCKYCNDKVSSSSFSEAHQISENSTHARCAHHLCDKSFHKRPDNTHLAAHLSVQRCICEVCGRSFSHISNLIRHSHIHTGLKPYPCKVCGRRFRQASALKQHKISHHDCQPIPCPALPHQCFKTFRTPVIARQHAYREHPNVSWENSLPLSDSIKQKKHRSFYCRVCGEEFQYAKDLRAHHLKHTTISNHLKNVESAEKTVTSKELQLAYTTDSKTNEEHHRVSSPENITTDSSHRNVNSATTELWHCSINRNQEQVCSSFDHNLLTSQLVEVSSELPGLVDSSNKPLNFVVNENELPEEILKCQSNFCTKLNAVSSFSNKPFENFEDTFPVNFEVDTVVKCGIDHVKVSLNSYPESSNTVERNNSLYREFNKYEKKMKDVCSPTTIQMKDHHGSDDCLLKSITEIDELGRFENQNTIELEAANSKQKDHIHSEENAVGQSIIEMNCSSVTVDVNMGLCPDSPTDSFAEHHPIQIHCQNEEDGLQCLNSHNNFENDNDLGNQFSQVKCASLQDNFQIAEPLILSFGESYSALLKEIGIVDENAGGSLSKSSDSPKEKDSKEHFESSACQWNSYFHLLDEAKLQDIENVKAVNSTNGVGQSEYQNNQISEIPIQDELVVNTLASNEKDQDFHNVDEFIEECRPVNNYVLTMELSNDLITLLPKSDDHTQGFLIFVAQENDLQTEAQINLTSNPSMVTGSISGSKKSVHQICVDEDSVKSKDKGSRVKSNHLAQVKDLAHNSAQDTFSYSEAPIQDFKTCMRKPNRAKKMCPECGKVFFKASNLSQHLGLHFPNMQLHKCDLCGQSFSWKSSLNKHMNSHSLTSQSFLCDICGKQYKSFDQVNQHKKRDHQSLRPHSCEMCSKSFFRKYDLLIHQRIHNNKKPYMCGLCGKTFNHLSHVKRHENVHHKDRTVPMAFQSAIIEFK